MTKAEKREAVEIAYNAIEKYRGKSLHKEYVSYNRRSGCAHIKFLSVGDDGRIADITWMISRICEYRINDRDGGIVAPFMNMDQAYSIMSGFNYQMARHDLAKIDPALSWNTPEGKKALGLEPDARIYDTYFFDINRM